LTQVLDIIMARRSDRHFCDRPVGELAIGALVEAFRWAPSSSNRQPWRLVFACSEAASRAFDDCLSEGNRAWAAVAPVKMVLVANPGEQPDRGAVQSSVLDCGLALQNLLLQGCSMGLTIHAMAGWDDARVRAAFSIGEPLLPVALVVAGYRGAVDTLAPDVQAKDRKPRVRRPVAEIVFADRLG